MKTYYISVTETLNRSEDFVDTDFNDETEETINNYELGGMPKYYEVK